MAKKYRRTHRISRLRNLSMHWYGFIFFIAVAVFLVIFNHLRPEESHKVKSRFLGYLVPVMEQLSKPAQAFGDTLDEIKKFTETKQQNEQMRQELEKLRASVSELAYLRQENNSLRELLNLQEVNSIDYITGRVISDSSFQFYRTVLLNIGEQDGVEQDMYAMAGSGLAGRVIKVGKNYSRVLLIQDWASRIPVMIADTSIRAVVAGKNTTQVHLIHLTGGNLTDLRRNMTVMTSGRGGVFPPGIPIGSLQILDESTSTEGSSRYNILPYSDPDKMTFLKIYPSTKTIELTKNDGNQQ